MSKGRSPAPKGGRHPKTHQRRLLWAGCLLSFSSGSIALVYELLWTRRFATLFGATAPAASVTISALFLGLGFGSAVIGSRSTWFRRPMRAYGMVEIGVGLAAILVDWLLGWYQGAYPTVHASLSGQYALALVVKSLFAALALLPPAFLMGGTLALLAQACISSPTNTGIEGSGLYAANTLGATAGALSVPFLWLPQLGVEGSYWAGVAASLVIGGIAIALDLFWLAPRSALGGPESPTPRKSGPHGNAPSHGVSGAVSRPRPGWLLVDGLPALAFLSGFLTLGLEVLWMRMLAQIHENSIYSFAIVLATFLVGLSLGAFLAQALLARRIDCEKTLGMSWILSGLSILVSPALFYSLSGGLSYASELGSPAWVTLGLAAATILLPTLLAGMILPLVLQLTCQARPGPPGPLWGRLLALNTAGAVVGPLFVTYLAFPGIGLWLGIGAFGLMMVLLGEAVATTARSGKSLARRGAVLAALAMLFLIANPLALPRVKISRAEKENLVHLEEGAHGIVAVVENSFSRWMVLNNFYTLGGTGSAIEERQQAQIPLFLHPHPRRVAFLGMGTGISAGGALIPPVERVVALEMVPEVIHAAREYFDAANLGLLRDPRVEVIREDAKIHLRSTSEKFDVIVGDLVVPWRSGEASLFTREHFETVRESLAPNGLFCQWLPMFQLSERQFRIVAATFLDVFPDTTLWRGDLFPNIPALALIGHIDPAPLDADRVDGRIRQLSGAIQSSSPILASQGGLWIFLVGPLHASDPDFSGVPRNRENRPWIELLSPAPAFGGRAQDGTGFVGVALYRYMEKIRTAPRAGSVLADLDQRHLQWREAGAKLWLASLTLHRGDEVAANRIAAESLSLLPVELRRAINGE